MRLGLSIYYATIVLALSGVALIVTTLITWDPVWSFIGASVALVGAVVGFWNIQHLRPTRHRRKDE